MVDIDDREKACLLSFIKEQVASGNYTEEQIQEMLPGFRTLLDSKLDEATCIAIVKQAFSKCC